MSLEEMGIKDVTPENSVGIGIELHAMFEPKGDIVHIMYKNKYFATMFDPELFFKNEDGEFLLRSNDVFIRVQKVTRA